MTDLIYWVWLAQKNGAGCSDAEKILKNFEGGAREIYEAPYERISAFTECSPSFLKRLKDHDLSEAGRILEFCFLNRIRVVPCVSPNYPRRLKALRNKPIVLYIRGHIEDISERFCVSIVGTRNMSGYGKHITFTLARQLIAYGAIIISGAAYGIDSAANSTAIFMEEPTVAVLGSGVNVPYPSKNKDMLDRIAANGMVISEFPPNTSPLGRNFPIRNRLISGLADAVVVVEAGEKSGALITARCAADQGKMVYAVPGNLGVPNSIGTNNMIRDGAKMVTCAEDIVEDFAKQFNLSKIDRIVEGEKYLRYEYNSNIPVRSENRPLSIEEQDMEDGNGFFPSKPSVQNDGAIPDIPKLVDLRAESRTSDKTNIKTPNGGFIKQTVMAFSDSAKGKEGAASGFSKTQPGLRNEKKSSEAEHILSLLGDSEKRVLELIPEGITVTTDKVAQSGIPTDEVLSSLTMLELCGAVEALPGGLYKRLI